MGVTTGGYLSAVDLPVHLSQIGCSWIRDLGAMHQHHTVAATLRGESLQANAINTNGWRVWRQEAFHAVGREMVEEMQVVDKRGADRAPVAVLAIEVVREHRINRTGFTDRKRDAMPARTNALDHGRDVLHTRAQIGSFCVVGGYEIDPPS